MLVTLAASCFSLLFTSVYKYLNNEHPSAETSYTFGATILKPTDDNYKNNDTFIIENKQGLESFALSVAYGCTFATINDNGSTTNKVVSLESDIDFYDRDNGTYSEFYGVGYIPHDSTEHIVARGYSATAFCGTFNGNGHVVQDFFIRVYDSVTVHGYTTRFQMKDLDDDYSSCYGSIGFFAGLGLDAVVYGLHLKNFSLFHNNDGFNSDSFATGAIAGRILADTSDKKESYRVQIQKCFVEGLYLNQTLDTQLETNYIGGLVGEVPTYILKYTDTNNQKQQLEKCRLTISNCAVKGITNDIPVKNGFNDLSGNLGTIISKAWNTITIKNETDEGEISYTITSKTRVENCLVYGTISGMQETPVAITYGGEVDTVFVNIPAEDVKLRLSSSTGGSNGVWYVYDNYNEGYPYLNIFIDWEKIQFDLNATPGSFEDVIYVPTSIISSVISQINGSITSENLPVAGEFVTAGYKQGYAFSRWELAENYKYNALYTKESYKISFENPTINGSKVSASITKTEIVVQYHQEITVSVTYNVANTVLTYIIGTQEVSYTISNIYDIDSYGSIGSTAITNGATVPDLGNNNTSSSITPILKSKQYSIDFG